MFGKALNLNMLKSMITPDVVNDFGTKIYRDIKSRIYQFLSTKELQEGEVMKGFLITVVEVDGEKVPMAQVVFLNNDLKIVRRDDQFLNVDHEEIKHNFQTTFNRIISEK